ncbi:MAG: ABC transporter ATP-binding protein [Victivallales bacterium]|nr:ABC transporter ATP-binding protein [Victivallales bacterium]
MPETNDILYHIEQLHRDFKLNRGVVHVLKGLSLELPERGWLALVGRSGSGKTTLLQLLGGLDRPTSGKILYRGQDLAKLSKARLTRLRRREFGFVFQSYHLLPELSAWENAALPALAWTDDRDRTYARARELLESFGLAGRLQHRPPELSGGEQQRVAIARALINDPPVLLADEPTGNLDEASARQVVKIFQDLRERQGKTIVMVTHDPKIAALADWRFTLG